MRASHTAGKRKSIKKIIFPVLLVLVLAMVTGCSAIQGSSAPAQGGDAVNSILGTHLNSIDIVLMLTVLSLLPSILIMLTGFTRIIIVLSLIRNGLGLQQTPPNQVLIGLALFLTFFIMYPVFSQINTTAYQPYVQGTITETQAVGLAMKPIREFMLKQTYKTDLQYFMSVSAKDKNVQNIEDVSNSTLIPAYITSELKRGFQIGFFIYIPFIVIDMIVSSTLMSMGMMMLPPTMISLPFKILLFVLVDGWMLTVKTLIVSFN